MKKDMKSSQGADKSPEWMLPRYFTGQLSEEEKRRLEQWAGENEENRRIFQQALDAHVELDAWKAYWQVDTDQAFKRVRRRIRADRFRLDKWRGTFQRVAAVLLLPLVLATAWLLVHRQPADTASTCELQTLAGMIGRVTLPDSTVVTLNAKSTLRYPSAFGGDERVVEFEGEGYFEVAKDASRRFTVRVPGRGDVNVYGTTFNIDAYRGNDCVTTLVEGSIGYSYTDRQGHTREYRLEPSQRLVHHQHNGKVEITEADCTIATAWKDNKIILQQTPLKDILGMLERKYDVDFQVDNDELYGYTFSGGAISMNGLEYVLETLEISSGIQWQYVGFQGYDTNPRMTVRIY